MPFYTFETIPVQTGKPVRCCELWQGMTTPPLERHPGTGEPLRRIYCVARSGKLQPRELTLAVV